MRTLGFIFMGIILLVLIIGASVGFRWLGIEVDACLGPKRWEVDTLIHRNSKSFVDASIREIRKLQTEYYSAVSDAHKKALRSRILHITDELDPKWIRTRPDLLHFIN